jgi:hypothetical protein
MGQSGPSQLGPSQLGPGQAGPIEIRGNGVGVLTFRVIPEVPAINRSSMTVSITGEPTGDDCAHLPTRLDFATDKAKTFLLALRNGEAPAVIADSRGLFQIEFAIAEDGSSFTVSQPGQAGTVQRFNAGSSFDVKTMAAQLLADLGP